MAFAAAFLLLLLARHPSAVRFAILADIENSSELGPFRRLAHVAQEGFEAVPPFVAYGHASAAVNAEVHGMWVIATAESSPVAAVGPKEGWIGRIRRAAVFQSRVLGTVVVDFDLWRDHGANSRNFSYEMSASSWTRLLPTFRNHIGKPTALRLSYISYARASKPRAAQTSVPLNSS